MGILGPTPQQSKKCLKCNQFGHKLVDYAQRVSEIESKVNCPIINILQVENLVCDVRQSKELLDNIQQTNDPL